MSASERRKGVRFEQHVARVFREAGFDCYRVPNSGGLRVKGDIAGIPAHIEAKDQAVLRMPAWLRQAATEAPEGDMPVVAFHVARMGDFAALPLEQLAGIMAIEQIAARAVGAS